MPRARSVYTFTAPAIPYNYEITTREKNVSRANDPVERRLTCAVTIVEEVFGLGVVDSD